MALVGEKNNHKQMQGTQHVGRGFFDVPQWLRMNHFIFAYCLQLEIKTQNSDYILNRHFLITLFFIRRLINQRNMER